MSPKGEKPIEWIGPSKEDLSDFPDEPRRIIGYALRQAQNGETHEAAKKMKGQLRDVIEIVADDDRGERTYRAAYSIKIGEVVYMLHAFQKKSRRGIATPKAELDLILQRLRTARKHYEEHYGKSK